MHVILLERIEHLGQMGDVVRVKSGFARNFLLPQGKALRASDSNKQAFEAQRAQLEAQNLKKREEAANIAGRMEGLSVNLIRQAGEAGQLYGSVNARDVATAIIDGGFTIDRHQVSLDRPIKTIGLHDVLVKLHPEVHSTVTVNVARSQDEADIQLSTGKAVIGLEEEEEEVVEEAPEEAVEEAVSEDTAEEETV